MAFVDADPQDLIDRIGHESSQFTVVSGLTHPTLSEDALEWHRWRMAYKGGKDLLQKFLEKYSSREKQPDFDRRKRTSPVFSAAKTAINNIRNAIFQRMGAVTRTGGSREYQDAVRGEVGGVDRRGTSMNVFMGKDVLSDLLVMGMVGIYLDAPKDYGGTLADTYGEKPYAYQYPIEDIRGYALNEDFGHPSQFTAVLLRDTQFEHDKRFLLPVRRTVRFRWVRLVDDRVVTDFFTPQNEHIETVETELERIPFVLMDTKSSVMRDVLQHQIAILNLDSTNMNFAMLQNFPKWVEKRSLVGQSPHAKHAANADGTATTGGQAANEETIEFGDVQGRTYPEEPPRYVGPPTESLDANRGLRADYEADINKMAHQAIADLATTSDSPFESGLAFLGGLMEDSENKLAEYYAEYETKPGRVPTEVAKVEYPDRWNLKSDEDRLSEAAKIAEMIYAVPGKEIKKELAKMVADTLFGGKVSSKKLASIMSDINAANYATSDPKVIEIAHKLGLVGNQTASVALGFDEDEHEKAQKDRAERVAMTQAAQSPGGLQNPAARGVPQEGAAPATEAAEEKEVSRNTDTNADTQEPVRGKGQNNNG